LEQHTFISAIDWIKYTADLGTYIFLIGALLQYVIIRLQAQISIPQTLTILIISRAISIVIAWMIWLYYPREIAHMYSQFVFIPAVISEIVLNLFSIMIVKYVKSKNG